MAAKGTEPEKPVEIEDADAWNAVVSKGNKDLNVIDVYAEWCGPCMCLIRAPPPSLRPPSRHRTHRIHRPPARRESADPHGACAATSRRSLRATAQRRTRKSCSTTTRC